MEAPEKIYLFENPIDNTPDYRWLSKRSCDDDIEFTRTDAFIEKTEEFLYEKLNSGEMECGDMMAFINNFKNHIKGE